MKKLTNKGFTLIELMIVVVIIGILAAVAIPQFLRYQLKSKTSEAPRNIGAIRTNEEAFAARWNNYAYAAKRPAAGGLANKAAWGSTALNDGFETVGFQPAGAVYYAYSVASGTPATASGVISSGNTTIDNTGAVASGAPYSLGSPDIWIQASANLDGAGDHGSFYATDEDGSIRPVPGNAGESTF